MGPQVQQPHLEGLLRGQRLAPPGAWRVGAQEPQGQQAARQGPGAAARAAPDVRRRAEAAATAGWRRV